MPAIPASNDAMKLRKPGLCQKDLDVLTAAAAAASPKNRMRIKRLVLRISPPIKNVST